MSEILTPPAHYTREPDFNPASSKFYSKGFNVRFSGGQTLVWAFRHDATLWRSHRSQFRLSIHCGFQLEQRRTIRTWT